MPSFCVSQLLPEPLHLDALVLEFAINDFFYHHHRDHTLSGMVLSPNSTMERLLRTVLANRPETTPLLLYVCSPKASVGLHGACDRMYSTLAAHYSVAEISLRRSVNASIWHSIKWDPSLGVHPDATGHHATAMSIFHAVQRLRAKPRCCCPRPLPPPLYVDGEDWGYTCNSCTSAGCDRLRPIANVGFHSVNTAASADGVARRFSWTATTEGSYVGFPLKASHSVLLSMLCTYSETAGNVSVSISPQYNASRRGNFYQLRWSSHSSQQCLVDVSAAAPKIPAAQSQVVWVTVEGGRVQIFAVISKT